MSIWSATGYVTDMPFVPGFYPELLPQTLNTALAAAGLAPPVPGRAPFRYIDLGAGYGITTALVAALYPDSEVYCVDFLAEHAVRAAAFRDQAGLGNLHVLEASFADLPKLGLAPFDYVCANAVASWVGTPQRHQILGFARDHLAADGCFFLSYNAYPGMANVAPLQRLILQLAEAGHGSSIERMASALDTIEAMRRRGAAFLTTRPDVAEYLAEFQSRSANYLVHEYLHRSWHAFYVADIVRELEAFGLAHAGGLGAEDLAFAARPVAAAAARGEDLQLHDFMVDRRYRRDLFVRRGRTPRDGAQCGDGIGRATQLIADADYRALVRSTPFAERLMRGTQATGDSHTPTAARQHLAAVAFLLGRGAIGLADARSPTDPAAGVQRYNAAVFAAEPGTIDSIRPLAVAGLSGGIRVDPQHHHLLMHHRDAASPHAPEYEPIVHLAHLLPILH